MKMMSVVPVILVLMITAAPVATSPHGLADPVAVIVEIAGDVRVHRTAAAEPEAATLGSELLSGDRLVVGSDGTAVLLYSSGRVHRTSESLLVEAEGGERASLFARTTRTLAQVASTDARAQPNRQGMIRPIAGGAVAIAPRNGITVASDRPTFVWFSVPGATGYTLQIGYEGSIPMRLGLGADTTWTLPATMVLEPGATYVWTVGATPDGRIAPPQRFRSATAEERRVLGERLGEIAAAGLDLRGRGSFLAALIYRDAGFMYEANELLDLIERSGMRTGAAFHNLRGEVYDALGMLDAAAAAFARAAAGE